MAEGRVKVGIIGSQFQADIQVTSFRMMSHEAKLWQSPRPLLECRRARQKIRHPARFHRLSRDAEERDIELVSICAPNSLHAQMTKDIAAAGKHIICEKPLAMTIAEGEEMIAVAKKHGVLLMYGEELSSRQSTESQRDGRRRSVGKIHLIKQSEKHFGPHSPWFGTSIAPVAVPNGPRLHGIAFCYWFWPLADQIRLLPDGTYVHGDQTKAEDESLCILEFENGAVGLIENSWARRGAWTIVSRSSAIPASPMPISIWQRTCDL